MRVLISSANFDWRKVRKPGQQTGCVQTEKDGGLPPDRTMRGMTPPHGNALGVACASSDIANTAGMVLMRIVNWHVLSAVTEAISLQHKQ